MKHIFIFLLGFSFNCFSQNDSSAKKADIYTLVEEMAEFPGGTAKMMEYVNANKQTPAIVEEQSLNGKVFLKFIVNENGKVSDVEILKKMPLCPACDEEAKHVVIAMPLWKPAKMSGKAVKCYFNLPILFR